MLVGYVFAPEQPRSGAVPAVVMMHGRGGAYSTRAKGVFDASTLSARHREWGTFWAGRGYMALLVDGFEPRGYAQGFPRFSYGSRPEALSEVTVRPLDAYGALAYLRTRRDVAGDRVGLQGWSNGGSATLAAMAEDRPEITGNPPTRGFRAALVFYAGCKLKGRFDESGYRPYAPVRLFHGTGDEEVSHRDCTVLVERSRALGGDIDIRLYRGATHSFDTPTRSREGLQANAQATQDAITASVRLFRRLLEP